MKKPEATGGAAGGPSVPGKGDTFSGRPLCWEMLTEDRWEDGSKRLRASVLVICDGGTAKLWLNDRACDRTAWFSGETVEACWDAMEEQLATGTVTWRASEGGRKKK